jgi:hypothetical protein
MTDYRIKEASEGYGFSIMPINKQISFKVKDGILNDEELILYVADSLTHEHIHKAILELFDVVTCRLFDIIEHHFRMDNDLHVRYLSEFNAAVEDAHRETYKTYTDRYGIDWFFDRFNITDSERQQAKEICNRRK